MRNLTLLLFAAVFLAPPVALAEPAPMDPTAHPAEKPRVLDEKETVEDDGYQVHLSLPTESDRSLWLEPGLRIEIAVSGGLLLGHGPSPRITETSFHLRTRLRLDALWSLSGVFSYSMARGDFTGLRWSALIEPMFHPSPSWGISWGLGYGGLDLTKASGVVKPVGASEEISSRTLDDSEQMFSCAGGAWVTAARLEYLAVIGPLFSTGPYLQADLQWTSCKEDFGGTDTETGQPAQGRQWWLNTGGSLGWWFSWR